MKSSRTTIAGIAASLLFAGLAAAQSSDDPPKVEEDSLRYVERANPDCREFRNACEVCQRQPDGKLACSNVGTACSPSGSWSCSVPSPDGKEAK